MLTVVTGIRPAGGRIGIAFSTVDRLKAAMGDTQRWVALSESALLAMVRPLGIVDIECDAVLVGARVAVPARVEDDLPA